MALLGLGELLQRALMGDRVADRVLEPVRAEAGDEQEVGDAGLRRFLVGVLVRVVREDDHGGLRRAADELLGERQAVLIGDELAVHERDVVAVRGLGVLGRVRAT